MCTCSVVSNSEILWTVAHQASLPIGFSNKNTRLGCHFLFKGVSQTQTYLLFLLHWQADSLLLSHLRSPLLMCISLII